jgi:hypothetical protein
LVGVGDVVGATPPPEGPTGTGVEPSGVLVGEVGEVGVVDGSVLPPLVGAGDIGEDEPGIVSPEGEVTGAVPPPEGPTGTGAPLGAPLSVGPPAFGVVSGVEVELLGLPLAGAEAPAPPP